MPESSVQLSIIIPVYKVEDYLAACLDSIIAQSFQNWEVIAVDDGSPDGSGAILDQYAQKDKRIRAIHKANGGVSSARNAGLAAAKGEYIGFVDGDDRLLPEMYQNLMAEAMQGGYDIVQCDYHHLYEDGSVLPDHPVPPPKAWNDSSSATAAYLNTEIAACVWNKVFRREVICSLRFDENLIIAEDGYFVFEACMRAESVKRISHVGYLYLQRQSSAIHARLTEKYFGRLDVIKRQLAACEGNPQTHYAAAHCASREAFSIISLILSQNNFREKLSDLRALCMQNRRLLLCQKEIGRRLRTQLLFLWLAPHLYYALIRGRNRLLGRK